MKWWIKDFWLYLVFRYWDKRYWVHCGFRLKGDPCGEAWCPIRNRFCRSLAAWQEHKHRMTITPIDDEIRRLLTFSDQD